MLSVKNRVSDRGWDFFVSPTIIINNYTRKFIRKWGTEPLYDSYQYPIINPKYNIGLIIYNATNELIEYLEPYFTNIYVNNDLTFQYENKIKNIDDELLNDIFITVNAQHLTKENIEFLLKIPFVLKQNTQIGSFKFDIFNIYIKNYNQYQNELIMVK